MHSSGLPDPGVAALLQSHHGSILETGEFFISIKEFSVCAFHVRFVFSFSILCFPLNLNLFINISAVLSV